VKCTSTLLKIPKKIPKSANEKKISLLTLRKQNNTTPMSPLRDRGMSLSPTLILKKIVFGRKKKIQTYVNDKARSLKNIGFG